MVLCIKHYSRDAPFKAYGLLFQALENALLTESNENNFKFKLMYCI